MTDLSCVLKLRLPEILRKSGEPGLRPAAQSERPGVVLKRLMMAPQGEGRRRIRVPIPAENSLGALVAASGLGSSGCGCGASAADAIVVGIVRVECELAGIGKDVIKVPAHALDREVRVAVRDRRVGDQVEAVGLGDAGHEVAAELAVRSCPLTRMRVWMLSRPISRWSLFPSKN